MKGYNYRSRRLPDGRYETEFHVKPINYVGLDGKWHPLEEIAYGFGNSWMHIKEDWAEKCDPGYLVWWMKRAKLINGVGIYTWPKVPLYVNTTSTFYPDPDTESTSVDGSTVRDNGASGESFATIRAGAGTSAEDTGATSSVASLRTWTTTDQYRELSRGYFLFDTSAIADTDQISSGTFSFVATSDTEDNLSMSISLTTCTTASNTAIATGDHANSVNDTTKFASDIAIGSFAVDNTTYTDFTLNASGLSNISKTGISKFGLKTSSDADNSAPTWSSDVNALLRGKMADTAGTTTDPKLVVVHAAPPLSGVLIF